MDKLEVLELYDNQITELRELDGGVGGGVGVTNLKVLDISYNVIRDMGPLTYCPNLQELYIAQNKIKCISGIQNLTQLRKLDLGANRIRTMPESELRGLSNLEELWLGKNKIECITGLSTMTKLRILDVQSNRLTRIEGLLEGSLVDTLEELYLSHNGIDNGGCAIFMESGYEDGGEQLSSSSTSTSLQFTKLHTLDLSRNKLTSTDPFQQLTTLIDLWISGNNIETFSDIETLRNLTHLDSVYLEYNPIDKEFEYRKRVAELVPSLTQIDATKIGGNGWGGGGGGGVFDLTERMRLMQDAAIQRAKMEEVGTNERKKKEE